jgi:hypothetical protein
MPLNIMQMIDDSPDKILRYLAENPEATHEQKIKFLTSDLPRDTCRRCGLAIVQSYGRWYHEDPAYSRHCRAASFTVADGWDEALDKTWTAAPR